MRDNKFNFDGNSYEIRPTPKKVRRRTMFDKNYVTLELIMFCLVSVVAFSAGMIGLMKWLG